MIPSFCITSFLLASLACCTASAALKPDVQRSLFDAIGLVERTHGCCSTQEISEYMTTPELFNGTKFVLDLSLFEYLAEQTEPQSIVNLAQNLTSSLLTFFSASPILVENRAVFKVFLNFELMAERLLMMKSEFKNLQEEESNKLKSEYSEHLRKIASCKVSCQRKIENCSNPFLFRFALEVGTLTVSRKVREFSKYCGDKVFQDAFPFDPIIQEYIEDMWETKQNINVEATSSEQIILTYLRLDDILHEAVGKDHIASPFILWLHAFSNDIFVLPEFYQNHIYNVLTECSPNFLLPYAETAFPEQTLVKYFTKASLSSGSSSFVEKKLNELPTPRLKYLFIKSTFLGLFQPSHFLDSFKLSKWIKNAITLKAYGSDECYILRFLFGNESEHLIVLGVLKVSNEEKEQLKLFRAAIRKAIPSTLKEIVVIPPIYNLLFIHSEDVQNSLLATFENLGPLRVLF